MVLEDFVKNKGKKPSIWFKIRIFFLVLFNKRKTMELVKDLEKIVKELDEELKKKQEREKILHEALMKQANECVEMAAEFNEMFREVNNYKGRVN